ncbi:MAG TPA: hypothetical protein VM537_12670, partial [Anaerolineae bacterium]|nr:hypothetical protein [Anaerolineae bacterium]
GLRAAQADLQAVVNAEVVALQSGDEEVYLSLQDFNDRQWYRHQELLWDALEQAGGETGKQTNPRRIVDLDLRESHAWVAVEYDLDGAPYRRWQFYRLISGTWRRTSPDLDFLGERMEKETRHLRFVYHGREADVIDLIGEEMQRATERLLAAFGLSEQDQLLTFEFLPSVEAQPASYSDAHFFVPSPLLLGVRADGRPDEELLENLTQSTGLYLALVKSTLYQEGDAGTNLESESPTLPAGQSGSSWVMLRGIVAWAVDREMQRPALPQSWHDWLQEAVAADQLLPLTALWPPHSLATDRDVGLAIAQAQAVAAYVAELRGSDGVPSLLESLGRRLSAAETIEAAAGMDLDAFEADWKEFLRQSMELR